jgi:hypothetical protein
VDRIGLMSLQQPYIVIWLSSDLKQAIQALKPEKIYDLLSLRMDDKAPKDWNRNH